MSVDPAAEEIMSEPTGREEYRERLWPSAGWWAVVPIAVLSGGLMVFPYGTIAWLICGLIAGVLTTAGLLTASPWVIVKDGTLCAGRAAIPVRLLGDISWAEGADATAERGPKLNARAYLLIRGWVDPVLKVAVEDPQDPTPYWLISTRRPRQLAAALEAHR